jgi:hypothetical protein
MDSTDFLYEVKKWGEIAEFGPQDYFLGYPYPTNVEAAKAQQALIEKVTVEVSSIKSPQYKVKGTHIGRDNTVLIIQVSKPNPEGIVERTLGRPTFRARLSGENLNLA